MARGLARLFALVGVLASLPIAVRADVGAPSRSVGRVRITELARPEAEDLARLEILLRDALALDPRRPFSGARLISVRPRPGDVGRFDATIYDDDDEKAYDLVVDAAGRELSRTVSSVPPTAATPDEREEAKAIVAHHRIWARALRDGSRTLYDPMPAVTVDESGRRLVNVGIMAAPAEGRVLLSNEVVSVDLARSRVARYATGAPPTSSAALLTCNPPPAAPCSAFPGSCAYYHLEWPAQNPVWKLNIRHPNCTSSVQFEGTGLELTDVYYEDELILQRAEVPVLNVKYNVGCGPYRDWLTEEDCFQASGANVAPGILVTTGGPAPYTFCESDPASDAGNFKGIAIHDQGDALWLVTELQAGWYRYVMQWRLHLDGSIEPIFGFGAVADGCTCLVHTHHAYWRFEWAIGGVSGNMTTGINTLARASATLPGQYDPITVEGGFGRPTTEPQKDVWKIGSPTSDTIYLVKPGALDGSFGTDLYAKRDYWALAWNPAQINDPNTDTSVAVGDWVNGEAIGASKRLVFWYAAGYKHDANQHDELCELVGPTLSICGAVVALDRTAYKCSDSVGLEIVDEDLAGAGTATIALSSTTEAVAENVTLTESPTTRGRFAGTIPTFTGPTVHGDGKISVAPNDTLTARYVDANSCGRTNREEVRTATIDCTPPFLSNVSVSEAWSHGNISWTTNEPATSVLHYGPVAPGSTTSSDPALLTSHRAALGELTVCSPYVFDLLSTDAVGNTGTSPDGGGSLTFTSGNTVTYASTGGPIEIPAQDNTGVTSSVFVPENTIVQDLEVEVNITHTADSNLLIVLTSPDGLPILLAESRGGVGNDFTHTIFDDEASSPISTGVAPFTGRFRPDGVLGSFDGFNAHGTWTLKVADSYDAVEHGTLDSWSLLLNQTCPPPSVPPPVPDGSFGSAMRASRADPAGSVVHLLWDAVTCPAPGYHVLFGPLQGVGTYALSGAKCALGSSGTATWTNVPPGDLWFVVTTENETGMEGSWGRTSSGGHVGGSSPSGLCGATSRLNMPTCP